MCTQSGRGWGGLLQGQLDRRGRTGLVDDLHVRVIIPLIAVRARSEKGKVITPVLDFVATHATLVPEVEPILNHGNLVIRHQHVIHEWIAGLIAYVPDKEHTVLLQDFQESPFEQPRMAIMHKTGSSVNPTGKSVLPHHLRNVSVQIGHLSLVTMD